MFSRDMTGTPQKCSRCGKRFMSQFVPRAGAPIYCRDCTHELLKLKEKEFRLEEKAKKAEAKGNLTKAERLRKKEAKLKKRE